VPDSPKDELARRLAEYPDRALPFLQNGFAAAAQIDSAARHGVLEQIIANLRRGKRSVSGLDFRSTTGLSAKDSEQVASAISIVVGLLSDSSVSPEEFVEVGSGVLFEPQLSEIVRDLAVTVCARRSELSQSFEQAQLAGAVLPSLFTFDTAVDLRMRFVDGDLKTSVPVCVVHIDTDASDHQLWVQLSRGDVESVIEKLNAVLADMDAAIAIVAGRVT
jgi:hypothetical protein